MSDLKEHMIPPEYRIGIGILIGGLLIPPLVDLICEWREKGQKRSNND